MASLVHAVGHVAGGRYGLPHGVAHGILLAPALRLLAPALGDDGQGGVTAGLADAVAALLARLPLPPRLRDAGVPAADLDSIAAAAVAAGEIEGDPPGRLDGRRQHDTQGVEQPAADGGLVVGRQIRPAHSAAPLRQLARQRLRH
jgi:hypothetical protein